MKNENGEWTLDEALMYKTEENRWKSAYEDYVLRLENNTKNQDHRPVSEMTFITTGKWLLKNCNEVYLTVSHVMCGGVTYQLFISNPDKLEKDGHISSWSLDAVVGMSINKTQGKGEYERLIPGIFEKLKALDDRLFQEIHSPIFEKQRGHGASFGNATIYKLK